MKIAFYGDSLTEGFPGTSYVEILKRKLPEHTLLNYGKGGDTVLSLYRRVVKLKLLEPVDITFLWVGVNDVFVKVAWRYPIFKTLLRQPWSRDIEAFREYYQLLLDLLCPQANKVVTVSPLFIGENMNNRWNKELEGLCKIIKALSASDEKIEYVNLRTAFVQRLASKNISNYIPKSAIRVVLDAVLLNNKTQIDQKASERGLYFTLDGVHLNSAGAEIVSAIFLKTINGERQL
jgi:lysophospholipase L1-like esterase